MAFKFRPLRADEIECRVNQITDKGCSILLYKDARCDQNILDETVGAMNWQRKHSRDNANCTVSIWDEEKKQWIEKEDTGTESNTEREKGLASDSFKRACTNWGIGRELYTSPRIWFRTADINVKTGDNGKKKLFDIFRVDEIEYTDGAISFLKIINESTGAAYVSGRKSGSNVITDDHARQIKLMLEETDSDVKRFLNHFNVKCVEDMSEAQFVDASKMLNKKMQKGA